MALGRTPSETLKITGTCAAVDLPNNTRARKRNRMPEECNRLEVVAIKSLLAVVVLSLTFYRVVGTGADHGVEPFAIATTVQRDIQSDDPCPGTLS
jgi:hypothetical protein